MDAVFKNISEVLEPLSSVEARQAIATGKISVGAIDSPAYKFAFSLIDAKSAAERDKREEVTLSIARSANAIALSARTIAIIAIIITAALAIISITIQLLIKK